MAKQADITVKRSDGTTNYKFTALSAAPGDGGFAQWRGEGDSPALSANLRMKTMWNAKRNARRFEASGNYPKVQTIGGIPAVVDFCSFSYSGAVPLTFTAVEAADFAAIIANTIASQLMRDSVATGFSPTN